MPIGTEVDKMYRALLHEGHTPESAARISQARTKLSLATARPPKSHKEPPKTGIQRRKRV